MLLVRFRQFDNKMILEKKKVSNLAILHKVFLLILVFKKQKHSNASLRSVSNDVWYDFQPFSIKREQKILTTEIYKNIFVKASESTDNKQADRYCINVPNQNAKTWESFSWFLIR